MTMMTPAAVVACNIYITAASSHSSTLLSLLRRAQDHCQQLRHQQNNGHNKDTTARNDAFAGNQRIMAPVAIIHAYADIPYDRSSFHLAGRPDFVSDVASRLICNALNEIDLDCSHINDNKSGENKESRHPFVGLVDHVSVMAMAYPTNDNGGSKDKCEAASNAAHEIGNRISKTNLVNVHYYGMACPNNTPLATVRREKTSFFKSGGAVDKEQMGQYKGASPKETSASPNVALKGDTTIGAPVNFAENFNIRLTSKVNFDQAKTLTQFLRGRNIETRGYGVAGVEALTLPYARGPSEGGKVYEVACNLLDPKEGSVAMVRAQLEEWIERQRLELSGSHDGSGVTDDEACKFNYEYFVEDAYPVGTTEEQCIRVLSGERLDEDDSSSETFWEEYDKGVAQKFQELLQ
mmetsp:Transcript_20343/g.33199  ORF Transcript_20343/g.33199 Transcript_20343/m.33199 type:complete len:407 (+) Transcript_20343:75-1295(+)